MKNHSTSPSPPGLKPSAPVASPSYEASKIRNFSIIAHIDHGKSTLADGFLQLTKAVETRRQKEQFLDTMDLERERGITIKAQTVRLSYKAKNGQSYQLNLIDTPGHVDFSYEVSRSLSASEGALLVVDASQGVEAQTIAHAHLARRRGLVMIPVLNKMDLDMARPDEISQQIKELMNGSLTIDILLASAKEKTGIQDILESVVQNIPPPSGQAASPLKALIFDSWFDTYQGVIILCRLFEGAVKTGDVIRLMQGGAEHTVLKLGVFTPFPRYLKQLTAGEVGFVITGIKKIQDVMVGDTLTHAQRPAQIPLEGFKKLRPTVFSSLFPVSSKNFILLKEALEKLTLNDSSLVFETEQSSAMGLGFRCGFLGLLHLEIVQERLEREFNLSLVATAPSVVYKVVLKNGQVISLDNPSALPDPTKIDYIEEPFVRVSVYAPGEYVGAVLKLCEDKRGRQMRLEYTASGRVIIDYRLPMSEMVINFHDQLKSITRGYGSMEYEWLETAPSPLVKVDILLNGEKVSALSFIQHKSAVEKKARAITAKLKKLIPRQQFSVAIQAAVGGKVIARETLSAYRKDVTAKLYGGDVTRRKKLLEKQKKGKKRMKEIGKIAVPQSAFMALLKTNE